MTFIDTVTQLDTGYISKGIVYMPVDFKTHNITLTNLHDIFEVFAYFQPNHTYEVTLKPSHFRSFPGDDTSSYNSFYWDLVNVKEIANND